MNNTVLRTISGTGFIILMLAGLLVNKFLYAGLVLFIMVVMMHEFYTIISVDLFSDVLLARNSTKNYFRPFPLRKLGLDFGEECSARFFLPL